jgi:acylphosphatase
MAMRKTVQVLYEGRVQGVGFRFTARSVSAGFDVAGYVRNLPDGRVELLASGEAGEVDDFLQALRESTLAGHIDNESTEEIVPPGGLRGFEIRA